MTRRSLRVSRRDFLARSGAAATVSAFAPGALQALTQTRTPIGLQLVCVREELQKNPAAVLAELKKMGYQVVEFAGFLNRSPAEWRKLLDDQGLRAEGHHVTFDSLLGGALKKTADDNAVVGNRQLIVPVLEPARISPRDAFMRTIDQIKQISSSLKGYNMRVGFHSEAELFKDVDGARPWDVLADHTGPDVVLQLDTGNAQTARPEGVDVVQVIRRNPHRVKTMHVKPFSKAKPAAFIGDDDLKWDAIVSETQKDGIEYYIIEYEVPGIPPLEALRANLSGFRKFYRA